MGEEIIKKVLIDSGLTEKEAEVYIFLSQHEVRKGAEIARMLKKDKAQVFRILRRLQAKGFVEATLEVPSRFTVVPFENLIDSIVKEKQNEVNFIKQAKKDLLSYLSKKQQTEPLEKFVVIKGNKSIYSKISQIIQGTEHQLSVATTVPELIRADRYGVFEVASNHPLRSRIKYRFLTELSKQNLKTFRFIIKSLPKTGFNFKARNPNLGLSLFPRMVIRDNEETLFFTTRSDRKEKDDVCLWTNCKSLVQAFAAIFEELWHNSTDIKNKISELETGRPTPKARVIKKDEAAENYYEMLRSAEEEIMLVTSSNGLIQYCKERLLIDKWKKSGVKVKIMAPIIHENMEASRQLQKSFAVRHIPGKHTATTIIDGKHIFQFKTSPTGSAVINSASDFDDILYTNELEYVKKMKNTLDDIWQKARIPSAITLEEIIGSQGHLMRPFFANPKLGKKTGAKITDIKPLGAITEKEVLDKIVHAEKIVAKDPFKDFSRMYASIAQVAIHPPDYFNLPDMMILVEKIEKQSSFGAEDALSIFLWLPIPNSKEYTYVPVATLGDNPKAQQRRKAVLAHTPAFHNVQLAGKDELQVRVHGNTVFAGWTIPITLYPPHYVLPPACLLIEGYGKIKTSGFTIVHPSGFKSKIEENYFDAFVTFMHPSSKYSGPGTDGVFARDYIATNYPPKSEQET